MQQSGGQIAAEHAEPPDGGEDRLSALPDELLVLILECLDTTAEAVRTSVLARRWPRLWPLLSKLRFEFCPDGNRIRELLDVPDAPELSYISVTTKGAAADSATAWLTAAARRLAGGLVYNSKNVMENDEEKARRGGNVLLPCFEKATMIQLYGLCGLVLPSVGVFSRLTDLSLSFFNIHGPCELGNVVSSPRCPCLQKLSIFCISELHDLTIHSESLLQMELGFLSMLHLTIVTPILQQLRAQSIFFFDDQNEPVANITAPQIVSLEWIDRYDPQYFHLGNLGQLQVLQIDSIWVYGYDFRREENEHVLRLLQQFQVLYSLHLELIYENEEFSCPFDCICDQPKNWKTVELVLDHLEDVHIIGLQGAEHEVAFVQRLLSWATVLKSLRITLRSEMTDDMIGEFCDALVGFSRPETCIQFDTSDKKRSVHPIDE